MIKLPSNKLVISFLWLLIVLCCSCETKETETGKVIDMGGKPPAVETKPEIVKEKPKEPPVGLDVVAKIGDYVIKKHELEGRLMEELRQQYGGYDAEAEPVDAKTVLMKMVAEKAMVMDARERNYLERETIWTIIERFKQTLLVRLLTQRYLQGKTEITDLEIDEEVKANPMAKAMFEEERNEDLLRTYYREVYRKLHVQKVSDNFPKAAEVHQRLLLHPKEPQRYRFIRAEQLKSEVTPEEKNIVLATYDGGKVTLKDWFDILLEKSPRRRYGDFSTPEGIERVLDKTLGRLVFVTEARLVGLDRNENFLKQVRQEEDKRLLNEIMNEKVKDVYPPTDEEQIIAYFNKNKKAFETQIIKIDEIWCEDYNTARKAKAELDSGRDFESVRQECSLDKTGNPFDIFPDSQGAFFEDIRKGEPNEIVGPIKGFYNNVDGFKWRIVKILEKKPGEVTEYSSIMRNRVKRKMQREQRKEALQRYQKELLEKYPYKIYDDRIKGIDPLNIP